MKKLIFAALFITVASASFAQDTAKSAKAKATALTAYNTAYTDAWKKLGATLNLTPTETSQWQALTKIYAPQYKAILTNSSLSQSDKQTQVTALYAQQDAALKKILTPAQNAEWDGIKKAVATTATTTAQAAASAHASHTGTAPTHVSRRQ